MIGGNERMKLRMEDWKKDRIASALGDTNPTMLRRMKSGIAVLGGIPV